MTDEEAKAVAAVAETGGKLVDLAQGVGKFCYQLIGPAWEELGLTLGDQMSYYRYRNLCRIADKVEVLRRERSLFGKPSIQIPERLALPLLQRASEENNEDLQGLWARLIANATDPDTASHVHRLHVELLSSLQPLDAAVLGYLTDRAREVLLLFDELGARKEDLQLSLINLGRLGLVVDSVPDAFGCKFSRNTDQVLGSLITQNRPGCHAALFDERSDLECYAWKRSARSDAGIG